MGSQLYESLNSCNSSQVSIRSESMKATALPVSTSDHSNSLQKKYHKFTVVWKDLSFVAKLSLLDRLLLKLKGHKNVPSSRVILNKVSGHFKAGQIMAVMGPSGCGKSTLLKSVFRGELSGRSGQIYSTGLTNDGDAGISTTIAGQSSLKMSFIPQHDSFFDLLTVRESVLFAARLVASSEKRRMKIEGSDKIWTKPEKNRAAEVDRILDTLGLTVCADNKIRLCSGGQQKRLSIAQELVKRPNVLILDEPTSGLDSSSTNQLIQYLRQLTKSKATPLAVVATIHQPSYKVFTYFHSVYLLSRLGQCIYHGSPNHVIDHFQGYGLVCPPFYNPADYAIEIAAGEYGMDILNRLSLNESQVDSGQTSENDDDNHDTVRPLVDSIEKPKHPALAHSLIIASRSFVVTLRDPSGTGIRFLIHLVFAFFSGYLFFNKGTADGCPATTKDTFDPSDLETLQNHTKRQEKILMDNCGNIIYALMQILYTGILSTALTFPFEMTTVLKERSNGWYNVGPYFFGKTIADFPWQVFFPLVSGIPAYLIHQQIPELTRFAGYISVQVLISLFSQSQGLLVSAIFVTSPTAAVYFAPMTIIPPIAFSGFVILTTSLPDIYVPLSTISCLKHSYHASLTILYGLNRCGEDVSQNMVKIQKSMTEWFSDMFGVATDQEAAVDGPGSNGTDGSGVTTDFIDSVVKISAGDYIRDDGQVAPWPLVMFEVKDEDLWYNYLMMIVILVTLRLGAFYTIRWQLNRFQ